MNTAPSMRRLGLSEDGRTNRWQVTPDCGHKAFEPRTTMHRTGWVSCPKCGVEYFVNYNEETIERDGK